MENDAQEPASNEAYPEDWDSHDKAVAEGDRNIKLKDGGSVTFHLISGPMVFREMYITVGYDEKTKNEKKKRIALPFGAQLPGFKLKVKYLVEVIVTEGAAKGQHKLFEFGIQIAKQLEKIKSSAWKSTRACDINVSRTGGGMDTEYFVTAVPSSLPATGNKVEFNLVAEACFSTKDDLNGLPKPTPTASHPDQGADTKVSPKQVDFIDALSKKKELTVKGLSRVIARKFPGKTNIGELTSQEASVLIDTIQAM